MVMEPENKVALPLRCWSYRFTVAVLCCLALINTNAMQSVMLTGSVCSLNSTDLIWQQGSWDNAECSDLMLNSSMEDRNVFWASDGIMPSMFAWGYLVAVLPSGVIAAWTGGHKTLGYCHLTMSVASLLIPVATNYMHSYTVSGLKFIAGMMAGVTYPSMMALFRKWAPTGERARLLALAYSGIPMGIVLASSTKQVLCFHGWLGKDFWSGLYCLIGSFGVLWFILWMLLVSSRPETNRRVTDAEKLMICRRRSLESLSSDRSLMHTVCSRAFWALVFVQLATEWGLYMLAYIVPAYLHIVVHINLYHIANGYMSLVPLCTFLVVLLLSSCAVDGVANLRPHQIMLVYKITAAIGALVVGAGFLAGTLVSCRHGVCIVIGLTVATAFHGLQYGSVMSSPLETGQHHVVVVTALSTTLAQAAKLGGITAVNIVASRGNADEWHLLFYATAGVTLSAGFVFFAFGSPTVPQSVKVEPPLTRSANEPSFHEMQIVRANSLHRVDSVASGVSHRSWPPPPETASLSAEAERERDHYQSTTLPNYKNAVSMINCYRTSTSEIAATCASRGALDQLVDGHATVDQFAGLTSSSVISVV